jgi:chromosome segregation ATPase
LDKKEKAIKAGKSKAQEVIANLQDKIKQLELEKAHEIEKLKQVVQDKDEQIRQLNNEQARDEEEDKDDALMMLKLSELRKNEQIEALTLERDRLEEEAHREMVNSMSNLQEIQAQLEVEKAKNALLTSQNQDFHKKRDSDKKITQLESDLDKKTAEASRLRNDLHHLKKQYERTASVNEKLADQHQHYLRNAAHLVAPSMHTKLPKNIYSCIACWMNNLQCDNLASCKNCTDDPNAQKCRRWRCSIMQIMKSCPGPPLCNLQHNEEGWLRLHVPRPEW